MNSTAFIQKHFPRLYKWITLRIVSQRYTTAPFTPLKRPIDQCRVALITSGGIHLDSQEPFRAGHYAECSYREIPIDAPIEKIRVSHNHYNPANVLKDLNLLLPRDRMREFEQEKIIGSVSPVMISFMGAILLPKKLIRETAPAAAHRLKQLDVDCAILTPA